MLIYDKNPKLHGEVRMEIAYATAEERAHLAHTIAQTQAHFKNAFDTARSRDPNLRTCPIVALTMQTKSCGIMAVVSPRFVGGKTYGITVDHAKLVHLPVALGYAQLRWHYEALLGNVPSELLVLKHYRSTWGVAETYKPLSWRIIGGSKCVTRFACSA